MACQILYSSFSLKYCIGRWAVALTESTWDCVMTYRFSNDRLCFCQYMLRCTSVESFFFLDYKHQSENYSWSSLSCFNSQRFSYHVLVTLWVLRPALSFFCYCSLYCLCYCFSLRPIKLKCIKLKMRFKKTNTNCVRKYTKNSNRVPHQAWRKYRNVYMLKKNPYNKKISSISLNSNKRNSEKTFVANWHHLEFCCCNVFLTSILYKA